MTQEPEDSIAKILEKLANGDELTDAESEQLRSLSGDELRRVRELERSLMREETAMAGDTAGMIAKVRRAVTIRAVAQGLIFSATLAAALFWIAYGVATAAGRESEMRLPAQFIGAVLTGVGLAAAAARLRRPSNLSRRAGLIVVAALSVAIDVTYHFLAASIRFATVYPVALVAAAFCMSAGIGWVLGSGALPFKRIYGTRLVSGVLLGISETLGWNVSWLRFALAVLLVVSPGRTILAYLFLDAAMQVHPDDRVHMWRFRAMRWWRGRRAIVA